MAKKSKAFNGMFGSEHSRNMGQMLNSGDYVEGKKLFQVKKNYISEEVNHFYIIFGGKYYQ